MIVPADRGQILGAMEGGNLSADFIEALESASSQLGYPVFMRTDLCSGKHDWKETCFVPKAGDLMPHLMALCEFNELAQIIGLDYTSIVLREFLELETSFTAFHGEMPINKERRYFVKEGKVVCHHPYWPAEAFKGHTNDPGWEAKLADLNYESGEEISLLSGLAKKAGEALGDSWSVDFAKAKNGNWYLIDMALAESSYHWEGCEFESLYVERFGNRG